VQLLSLPASVLCRTTFNLQYNSVAQKEKEKKKEEEKNF
jgi:hypothetical protein